MDKNKTAGSLRIRYILGLTLIALLVTGAYLSMQRIISEQRNFASLISLAGHQAGLANRIVYFSLRMATTDDKLDFNTARSQVRRSISASACSNVWSADDQWHELYFRYGPNISRKNSAGTS